MLKGSILPLLFLAAAAVSSVYKGQIFGNMSNPKFAFSHTSNWQSTSRQIINTLKNDHNKAALIASWPDAGIFAPNERPLPPGKSDTNSYYSPPDKLSADFSAKLFYGLGHTPKTAGVYMLTALATGDNPLLRSKITASTEKQPYTFEVTSKLIEKGIIEYTFKLNRAFYFLAPLPLSADSFKLSEGRRMEVLQRAFEQAPFRVPSELKEKIVDPRDYKLFKPQSLTSVATITSSAAVFRVVSVLVFIANSDYVLQASGYVTVHLP